MSKSFLRILGLILSATAITIAAKYYFPLKLSDLVAIDSPLAIPQIHILKNFLPQNLSNYLNINFHQTDNITEISNSELADDQKILFSQEEFPLGWFDRIDRLTTSSKISQEGFNLLLPYSLGKDFPSIKQYLDNAQNQGVKVIVQLYPGGLGTKEKPEKVKQFVRAFKGHPALFGWYIADEPDFNNVKAEYLETIYQAIKAEDPTRPVAIAFNTSLFRIKKYADAFDILMYDKYPCKDGYSEFSFTQPGVTMDFTRKRMKQMGNYAKRNNKMFFPILQAFGKPNDPMNQRRLCSEAETKYLVYMSLLAGADGLFFWTHHRTEQGWIDRILLPITEELHNYLPAIKNKPLSCQIKTNRLSVKGCLYQNPSTKEYILIAINHGQGTVKTSMKLDSKISLASAKVVGENRDIRGDGDKLQDIFRPYEVHIYQLSSSL